MGDKKPKEKKPHKSSNPFSFMDRKKKNADRVRRQARAIKNMFPDEKA